MMSDAGAWFAGVDGCRGGWIAAFVRASGDECRLRVFASFRDVISAVEKPSIIAIDMPIGLPDSAGAGGRAAERTIRPLLSARQSSVFSVPSRAAIDARDYAEACAIALATSDPPRKVSRQTFGLAPKIREIDAALREDAALAAHVFEVHPELAFWRLNGDRALNEPKHIKNRRHPPGLAMRQQLLARAGLLEPEPAPPRGAKRDDVLDAMACAAIARRIAAGVAEPFPSPPEMDSFGLRMAIWA